MSIFSRCAAPVAAVLLIYPGPSQLSSAEPPPGSAAAPAPFFPPSPPGADLPAPASPSERGALAKASPSPVHGKKSKPGTGRPKKGSDAPVELAAQPGVPGAADVFDGRQTEKISLEQAIELALRNNLDAKFELTGIRTPRAQVKIAAAAFDPVFVMNAQHQETRVAEDTNNPSTVTEVNQQQQLQLQLNQASQSLNSQLLTAQSNALAIANVAQTSLANNLAAVNQQLSLLGEKPISLAAISGLNPSLLHETPLLTPNLNEIVILDQVNTQATVGFQGKTTLGTRWSISAGMNEFRNTFTGNIAPVFELYQSTLLLQVQQPLLRGFGRDANLSDLRGAKISAKVQTLTWKNAVSTSVQGVMAAYYDMLAALKDIQVRQEQIVSDSKLVELYRRRVELGFGSPFDISQAEVAVSTDRESLLVSKNNFLERQFALKRLIVSRFNRDDGRIYVPEPTPNLIPPAADRGQLLHTAFENRYDFRATLLNSDLQDIRLKYAKNQLLPELDLIGNYGFDGLERGVAPATDNLVSGHQPQWLLGIQFQMPLGNRAARAQYDAYLAQKQQAIIRVQQSEIAVGVDVDTVISRIEMSRQRVEAARKTRELNEQAIRIGYRRLEEGQISAYDITDQQRKLYDARSRELGAQAELNKAVTLLWQVTGTVLTRQHIVFDEPAAYYTPPPDIRDAGSSPEIRDSAATVPLTRH